MKTHLLTAVLAAGIGAASLLHAQQNPPPAGASGETPGKKARIEKFDKDGDGKLNKEEKAAAKDACGHKHGHKGKKRGKFQREIMEKFDKDGDGKLSEAEREDLRKAREEHKAKILAEFDKDKDGKLNEEERAAAKAARQAKKSVQPE